MGKAAPSLKVTMTKRANIAGQKFGALLALSFFSSKKSSAVWLFSCDCGAFIRRVMRDVKSTVARGCVPSCGCRADFARKTNGKANKTHGFSQIKLYDVHRQMMRRCYNEDCKDYPCYGERGITVCDEWHDLATFIEWCKSSGYRDGLTIERVDVNAGYEPSNCTWIVNERQAANRRHHVLITAQGLTMTASDWARKCGISRTTLITRLRLGWNHDDVVSKPVCAGGVA